MEADGLAPPTRSHQRPAPQWPWIAGTALSVIGLGLAGYLTYEHYTSSTSLSCPAGGGMVDCLKVTTSQYSKIHGMPVALLGLVFFAVMIGLQNRPSLGQHLVGSPDRPARVVAGRCRHGRLADLRRAVQTERRLSVVHHRTRHHPLAIRRHRLRHSRHR